MMDNSVSEARMQVRVAARTLGAKSWSEGKKDKAAYAIVLKDVMEAADAYALAVHDQAALVPKWYENDRTREQLDELANMREHIVPA